jgi:hypothetical protein
LKKISPLLPLIFLVLFQNSVGQKSSSSVAFSGISTMPHLLMGSGTSTTGLNLTNTSSIPAPSSLLTGIVSYWALDETSGIAIDVAGGLNNGIPTSVTQGVAGKINTAYAFNGTSSKVDMGNPVNLSLTSAGSLSCWVYPSGNPSDGIVASKGNFSSDTYGYGIDYLGANNVFEGELANGSAHQTISFNGVKIVLKTWYYLSLTWDGTTIRTYINGIMSSAPQKVVPVSNVNDFVLGYNFATHGAYFNGKIDEVGVWSRALTTAEVTSLYNSGTGNQYQFNGGAANIPPVAIAGPNQSLSAGIMATTLNGSGTDADGVVVSYGWTQTAGPTSGVTINPNTSTTTGVAQVTGLSNGNTYTFKLTVTDNEGATNSSTMNVMVGSTAGGAPTANAGANQSLPGGITSDTLSGSGTGSGITFAWTHLSGGNATITTPSSPSTTITGLSVGTYNFQLTVTDNSGNSAVSTMSVTVYPLLTANAGNNQSLLSGTTSANLSGSASGGSGNYSYLWTLASGANCTISNNSQASINVTGLKAGSYTFNLLVTDLNTNATANSTVQITVSSSGTIGSTQLNHGSSNPYTVSGQSYNLQSANNDYMGVISDRSATYQFNFLYNYITSNIISGGGGAGYMLEFGDEEPSSTNWRLNGMVVSGNYLNWTGGVQSPPVEPHGVFAGAYNADVKMTYNYLNQVPMALIEKSDGSQSNSTNRLTSGGICYNIVYNPQYSGVNIKGMANTNVYNNTFYQSIVPATAIIDIYDNTAANQSQGTHIYNNIFYTTSTSAYNISVDVIGDTIGLRSDYNVFYCTAGTPMFRVVNTTYTFSQWQALGHDAHSVVVNPNFLDFTNFVPSAPLYYGTNLGAAWQTGLAANAVWSTSAMPGTTNQGSIWQVGARIISQSGSLTASAGPNQTLPAGTTSTVLYGSASESNVTYSWKQTSGASATITVPSSAETMVTGLTGGTYTFLVTATDNAGNIATSRDTILVNTSATLTSGLISYWTLDEKSGNAIDIGGGGNNGIPTSITQNVIGKINTAYGFNGTSSKVDMGHPVNLSLTSAGSLSCWVYPSGNPSDGIVASKGNFSSDTYGYGIDYLGANNVFEGELATGSAHQILGFNGVQIVLNTWYHLVITWDGTTLKTYINGIMSSAPQKVVPISNVNDFVLGYNYATKAAYFNGRIDEVGIWNRALTATEVMALYASATGISYPFGQTTNLASTWNPTSSSQISNVRASSFTAYPNPYTSKINFNISASSGGRGSLVLYDLLGRKVATVFEGDFVAGSEKTFSYEMRKTGREPLIYVFKIGSEIIQGKLLPLGN